MAALGTLVADIRLRTAKFTQGTAKVNSSMKKMEKSALNLKGVMTGIIGGASIAAFTHMTRSALQTADATGKMADKIGISTNALQELRFAASQTGVSQEKLDMALQRMTRRLSEAAQGSGAAAGAIEELGLDAQALANASPDKAFKMIADAMVGVENQSDRVRLAFKFFDSEGVGLVNTLADGSAGLERFAQTARDMGMVMDEQLIRNAEKTNDQLDVMNRIISTQVSSAMISFAPQITAVAEAFGEAARNAAAFFDSLNDAPKSEMGIANQMVRVQEKLEALRARRGRNKNANTDKLIADQERILADLERRLQELRTGVAAGDRPAPEQKKSPVLDLETLRKHTPATSTTSTTTSRITEEQRKLNEMLREAERIYESTRNPLEAMNHELERLRELSAAGSFDDLGGAETIARAEDEIRKRYADLIKETQTANEVLEETAEEGATGMADQFKTGLFDVLNGDITSLEDRFKDFIKNMAFSFLESKMGGAGGGGGIFSSVFNPSGGGGLSGLIGSIFARAHGGPVTGDRPYLVGEQGPELFVPPGSGQIVPNDAMGGVKVTMVVNTPDAQSFKRSQSQIVSDTSRAISLAAR